MFNLLKKVLGKTNEAIKEVAPEKKKSLDKEEFEDILLEADVHYDLVEKLLEDLPDKINRVQAYNSLISVFQYKADWKHSDTKPFVEMIIGVNGAGKTTTIAKLAYRYTQQGKRVILGAGDTFRAAAIEQLSRWAEKLDLPIIATRQGHDPSAVVYDTIESAKAKGYDHVIIDTAGRLHTQTLVDRRVGVVGLGHHVTCGGRLGVLGQLRRAEHQRPEDNAIDTAFRPGIEDALVVVHHALQVAHHIHPQSHLPLLS